MEFLYVEDTELIYTNLNEPMAATVNLPYSSITTIFYGVRTKKLLFGLIKYPQQHITIRCQGRDYLITEKDVGKAKLEQYRQQLLSFAHRNHVTARETTGDTKDDWRY